jgi:hypothetical protein
VSTDKQNAAAFAAAAMQMSTFFAQQQQQQQKQNELQEDEEEIEEDDDENNSLIIVDENHQQDEIVDKQKRISTYSRTQNNNLHCRQCDYDAEDLSDLLVHRKAHASMKYNNNNNNFDQDFQQQKTISNDSDIENDDDEQEVRERFQLTDQQEGDVNSGGARNVPSGVLSLNLVGALENFPDGLNLFIVFSNSDRLITPYTFLRQSYIFFLF